MGTIFALRSRYLTLKNHISGYEKVLDFWKTDLLYWGHTVTFRPQLKKIWDYDFFAWYLHLQIYSKTFRQSVLSTLCIYTVDQNWKKVPTEPGLSQTRTRTRKNNRVFEFWRSNIFKKKLLFLHYNLPKCNNTY